MAFIQLTTRLKDGIASKQKVEYDVSEPLQTLPHNVHEFLSEVVDNPSKYIQGCWTALAHTIWQQDTNGDLRGEEAKLMLYQTPPQQPQPQHESIGIPTWYPQSDSVGGGDG